MAIQKLFNLARVTTTTVGTGTMNLGSAVPGFLTFDDSGVQDGDVVSYGIRDGTGSEVGRGTYNSSGSTLSRDTIIKSTNANAAIPLTGAGAEVFITPLAEDFDVAGNLAAGFWTSSDIASAATCNIGAATTPYVRITGTTTITSFGTAINKIRLVRFAGILTLTHNGTSLILPGLANVTTAAGDEAEFASDGSGNWKCTRYLRANGTPPTGTPVGTTDTQSLTNKTVNKLTITPPATSATLTVANGKTLTASNSLTLSGTDSATLDFSAWATSSPAVISGGGTLTTASCSLSYKQVDKTIFWRATITVTDKGTGTTDLRITTPFSVQVGTVAAGYEDVNTGKMCCGSFYAASSLAVRFYDSTFPGSTNNNRIRLSGVAEAA